MGMAGYLDRMDKVQAVIGKVEKVFGIVAMAFIIVINIYGIASRYFLDQPVIYIQELTILGAVWLFFIGMGLVFKVHSDITVEFVFRLMPNRLQLINELMVDVLTLFFLVSLVWLTCLFIPFTRGPVHHMSFALGMPDEIYYYPIALGAISIFLTVFQKFVGHLLSFRSDWQEGPDRNGGES